MRRNSMVREKQSKEIDSYSLDMADDSRFCKRPGEEEQMYAAYLSR
jgi:hypothetical protein